MITTTYYVQEYRTEISQLFIEQRLNDGPYLQTVGDYRSWMREMLNSDLPAYQEGTVRVLRGEAIDKVRREIEAAYFGDGE
ncbi:MAG: hypothetical protein GVY12_07330 [Bacteroidetes bacterium]|nr:hypothetical protein [Bacteroidota bacterium]